jgi:DNA-binding protein H-NS
MREARPPLSAASPICGTQLALLEAEQRAQERQHRTDVLRAMKELLLQHGFKPAELNDARPVKSTGRSGGGRRPVVPLYRDPATGATWSGRGTEPAWIKGRDRQAFKVAGSA